MRNFIIPAFIAMLTIATSATVNAQSGTSSRNVDRDAMIGQLETMLDQLKAERESSTADAAELSEVEGSLSADESQSAVIEFSNMGSYGMGNSNSGQSYSQGYSTGVYSNSMGDSNGLPMESYAAGQPYQSDPIYQSAPMVEQATVYQSAPIVQQAPMAYAAPMEVAQPVPMMLHLHLLLLLLLLRKSSSFNNQRHRLDQLPRF